MSELTGSSTEGSKIFGSGIGEASASLAAWMVMGPGATGIISDGGRNAGNDWRAGSSVPLRGCLPNVGGGCESERRSTASSSSDFCDGGALAASSPTGGAIGQSSRVVVSERNSPGFATGAGAGGAAVGFGAAVLAEGRGRTAARPERLGTSLGISAEGADWSFGAGGAAGMRGAAVSPPWMVAFRTPDFGSSLEAEDIGRDAVGMKPRSVVHANSEPQLISANALRFSCTNSLMMRICALKRECRHNA